MHACLPLQRRRTCAPAARGAAEVQKEEGRAAQALWVGSAGTAVAGGGAVPALNPAAGVPAGGSGHDVLWWVGGWGVAF